MTTPLEQAAEPCSPIDGYSPSGKWLDPTPEMLETMLFDTIWRVIKTWDVNVPHAYSGYCGANGNHVRAIYDAVTPYYQSYGEQCAKAALEKALEAIDDSWESQHIENLDPAQIVKEMSNGR